MFSKDRKSHEKSPFSHYKVSGVRPVQKKGLRSDPEIKEYEENSITTLKTSSLPFNALRSESSSKAITRFNSLSPPQSFLFSAMPLSSKISGDSNTPLVDSSGYSSSELPSDIMLPPNANRSPLRFVQEDGNLEYSLFKISLYIIRCFYDRQRIERFFNSDQFVDPRISKEAKDVFFKILLAQLTPEQARILKHREYVENLVPENSGPIQAYLDALITGKDSAISPFSENILLSIRSGYLLQTFCENYLLFEFVFSENSTSKIDRALFILSENFSLNEIQADRLCENLIRFLCAGKIFNILSLISVCTLIGSINRSLQTPEKIDSFLNALISTQEGNHLLCLMNINHAVNFIDFLRRNQKTEGFFSTIIDIFALASGANAPKRISAPEQEPILFTAPAQIAYFIQHLPNSSFIEEMLLHCLEPEKIRFFTILWNLNLLTTDTLIFKKIDLLYYLEEIDKEQLIKRLKRWFSIDALTDSPEIQRAFMHNEDLMKSNHEKLQACQSLIISDEQAKTIQNLQHAIVLNELKAEWVNYFKIIWALLLEHWDPQAHLLSAPLIRNSFRKVMLERLERSEEEAYSPEFYQLAKLPAEMAADMLQSPILIEKYQTYLDKMAICYEQITACRKRNKKMSTDPFPKLKGYISFQTLLTLLIPSLSEQQSSLLSKKFIQLFVLGQNDHDLGLKWSEKSVNKPPEMLYISTHLSQEFIYILRTTEVFKLSKTSFHTDYCLKKKAAQEAILKIYDAIHFIHRISLPSGNIEGHGLKGMANRPNVHPHKEEKPNINSPPAFFSYARSENSPPIHKAALIKVENTSHSASSSHHSEIPLMPRQTHDLDAISFNLSGFISTEIKSDNTLSASPRKR